MGTKHQKPVGKESSEAWVKFQKDSAQNVRQKIHKDGWVGF